MISVQCNRCEAELTQPGALAFSPPKKSGDTHKYHLCLQCWHNLVSWLRGDRPTP